MITDKYITPEEMMQIVSVCNNLKWLESSLVEQSDISTTILFDDDGGGRSFEVYDSNGELLGHIGHSDNGFALYLDNGEEAKEEKISYTAVPDGQNCPVCGRESYGGHIPLQSMNCKRA